ncbi:MAG: DNA repair protein [Variovorax paradoxus]|nr:MAG: DNA repair protein [Variovorax paradoxus]PZQ09673.1 MAG: DNA repair protein [Variovorax paradoxus]
MSSINAIRSRFRHHRERGLSVRDANGVYRIVRPAEILQAAQEVLAARLVHTPVLDAPSTVKDYLRVKLGTLEHEVFGVVFLSAQHAVIAIEELFRGSASQATVYPREVVKRAMQLNASACILFHNHPSGTAEPSRADEYLTSQLQTALKLVDCRVLDHLIATSTTVRSMAEMGLI